MWLQENFSRVIFYFYFLLPLGWFLSVGSSFAPSRVDSLRLFKTQAQQHLSALPSWAHRGAVLPSPPRPSSTRLGPPWPCATLRCLRVSRRPGRRPPCRAAFLPLPEPLPFSGDARPTLAGRSWNVLSSVTDVFLLCTRLGARLCSAFHVHSQLRLGSCHKHPEGTFHRVEFKHIVTS